MIFKKWCDVSRHRAVTWPTCGGVSPEEPSPWAPPCGSGSRSWSPSRRSTPWASCTATSNRYERNKQEVTIICFGLFSDNANRKKTTKKTMRTCERQSRGSVDESTVKRIFRDEQICILMSWSGTKAGGQEHRAARRSFRTSRNQIPLTVDFHLIRFTNVTGLVQVSADQVTADRVSLVLKVSCPQGLLCPEGLVGPEGLLCPEGLICPEDLAYTEGLVSPEGLESITALRRFSFQFLHSDLEQQMFLVSSSPPYFSVTLTLWKHRGDFHWAPQCVGDVVAQWVSCSVL